MNRSLKSLLPLCSLFVCCAIATTGVAAAADPTSVDSPAAAAPSAIDAGRPVIPNRAELPDSAFGKLDVGGKGYVTREETRSLQGFDPEFQMYDRNHDGKLTADEFNDAWKDYTGNP